MAPHQKPNIPTVFIIFGATGDLMSRKIVPALFHLFRKNRLPKLFTIIGVARRPLSSEEFKEHILHILQQHKDIDSEKIDAFLKYFMYEQGRFENPDDYQKLAQKLGRIDGEWKVCSNKLFYLAVPPIQYETIFQNLASSGLTIPCSPEEGWTRVIVEKPFGKDLETAEHLDEMLGKLFREEQIYRIDHYLAKDMLQNILAFRFSNNLLEGIWNNRHIEKIEVKILEKSGVEKRGEFYDGVGALKDIGQNHMLQMLSLVTMDNPGSFETNAVREKRAKVLSQLEQFEDAQVTQRTFRGQYEGYKNVEGVSKSSKTETYFKIKTFIESARWQGVPIYLEGGKTLAEDRKEVAVFFKHDEPCMCPPGEKHRKNKIIFSVEPKEEITIRFFAKEPGLSMNIAESMFSFDYKEKKKDTADEYERLLLDCIEGNQLLFVSTTEVKEMWRFIDPIVSGWMRDVAPLVVYQPFSNEVRDISLAETQGVASIKKEIAVLGLGKMGAGTARLLLDKGWKVVGYNRSSEKTKELEKEGLIGAYSLEEVVEKLSAPRILYLMLPAGATLDQILFGNSYSSNEVPVLRNEVRSLAESSHHGKAEARTISESKGLVSLLSKGDIIIDAGNSFYKDSIERSKKLEALGLRFLDVGTSGGPAGARNGACLMIGGKREDFEHLLPLFIDLSKASAVQFFEGAGAGHFVKMVHNGIEYGMMQAIAEGFEVLKKSSYNLDLTRVAEIYNNGSVIESRLVGWLKSAFEIHTEELNDVSGVVAHSGEGKWTVEAAAEMGIKVKIIEESLKFRIESENNPSYTGKVVSALREQFGGHKVKV